MRFRPRAAPQGISYCFYIFPTALVLTVLEFLTKLALTVLIFPTNFVLTVLIFPSEIVLTVLAFLTEIVLTVVVLPTEIVLTVLICLTKIVYCRLDIPAQLFLFSLRLNVALRTPHNRAAALTGNVCSDLNFSYCYFFPGWNFLTGIFVLT